MTDFNSIMERQRKEAVVVQRLEETHAAFATKGVGCYPTERGVTIDGQTVNLDPLEAALLPIITTTCQYCGQTPGGQDIAFMAQEVARSLRLRCGSLHLEEVKEACEIGRDGEEFGEVFGINAKTILHWVTCYANQGYHARYKRKFIETLPVTRQLPDRDGTTRADVDLTHRKLMEDYTEYREGVLKREQEKNRAQAGSIGTVFRSKINRDPVYDCGDCLWDGAGKWAGYRSRWMNEHGFPGVNLKEIFDNMIRRGIEKF